jgi:cobalt-zinc-cadmium efflux system outer membrane protein
VSSERQPEGGWNLGPSLSLALPIFDQGQPNVARLESGLRSGERGVDAARLDARSDVREAAARLAGARARAERLRNQTIPIRERLVRLTLQEYNYMLVGAFDLLVAKRDELGAYRDYLGALRDYWIAFSDLEAAVGRRIEVSDAAPDTPSADPGSAPHSGHSMPMKDSAPPSPDAAQPPHHHGDL